VRFGDPVEAGKRIAATRPGAAARERGVRGGLASLFAATGTDLRAASRRLLRAPGFATVVVLTLALGVGANSAIFTVLHAVLLDPLPYADPSRLVRVYETSEEEPGMQFIRAPVLVEWTRWSEVFDVVGAVYTYRETGADLTTGQAPRRVSLMRVSNGYFDALGVAPRLGRTFLSEESLGPGESGSTATPIVNVAVLAHRLWQEELGGTPDAVGSTIDLDGVAFQVVGVMPSGFEDPLGAQADVWVPQDLRPGGSNNFGNYYLSSVARLRAGLTVDEAQARLRTLAAGFAERQPEMQGAYPAIVALRSDMVGSTRTAMLWILAGAAGLVLLTACVNVANLLLARGLERDRDLAVRSALGSRRSQMVASILAENALLAVLGGAVGLTLGWLGLQALVRAAPEAVPITAEVTFSWPVFAFGFAVTVCALVTFGLAPAFRLSRVQSLQVLRGGARASASRLTRRMRDALVTIQVAAALVLVAGALLLARSFSALANVPLHMEPEGVLTFEVNLPSARYPDRAARDRLHTDLQERVASLPGVEAVGAVSWLPVSGRYHIWGIHWNPLDPADRESDEHWYGTDVRVIAGDYFSAMGIDVLRGMGSEVAHPDQPVAWVNRTLAEEVFGDREALGQRIWLSDQMREVVGVVDDVPYDSRGATSRQTYIRHGQADDRNWALVQTVKARGDMGALQSAVRAELALIDPQLVLHRPQSLDAVLDSRRAQDRFATLLMSSFALLALTLALVGTYGVLSRTVAGRTREIGIRLAMGADTRSVQRMVFRHAAALTLPGIVIGLFGAWLSASYIDALLFGVAPHDPVAFGGSATVFFVTGLLAAWLPYRRALSIDPVQTLTAE
jgi:predicted permease